MVGSLIGAILLTIILSAFEYGFIDELDSMISYEKSKLIQLRRLKRIFKYDKSYPNYIPLLIFFLQIMTMSLCVISIVVTILIALFFGKIPLIITVLCIFVIHAGYLGVIRILEIKYRKETYDTPGEDQKKLNKLECRKKRSEKMTNIK